MQEHRTQRPADRTCKAGDQGNPGDRAACVTAIEPGQSSKGWVVKTHADPDAEHSPGAIARPVMSCAAARISNPAAMTRVDAASRPRPPCRSMSRPTDGPT